MLLALVLWRIFKYLQFTYWKNTFAPREGLIFTPGASLELGRGPLDNVDFTVSNRILHLQSLRDLFHRLCLYVLCSLPFACGSELWYDLEKTSCLLVLG